MDSPCSHVDRGDRGDFFERLASKATYWTGTTSAFMLAVASILLWLAVGHHFHYSDTWQLVVNTGTTVVTFLMVFLIQRSQNRDMLALKVQMDELIASMRDANNVVIDLDDLSERQLMELHRAYRRLSRHPVPTADPSPPAACPAGREGG